MLDLRRMWNAFWEALDQWGEYVNDFDAHETYDLTPEVEPRPVYKKKRNNNKTKE